LVSIPESPAALHDEFAQALIEGLPSTNQEGAAVEGDVYRKKLQRFLAQSSQYQPMRILKLLPPLPLYPQENALLLSRLGRHREVLRVHVQQLQDLSEAEAYCERVYRSASSSPSTLPAAAVGGGDGSSPSDIYLTLLEVLIA
jgi:hypothetical protein